MASTHGTHWRLWGWVVVCLMTAGGVGQGMAQAQGSDDMSQRLSRLEACTARARTTVQTAVEGGVSAGTLAPANSAIADAEDAFEDVQKLQQDATTQEASDRLTKALDECAKIDPMVARARQDTEERKVKSHLVTDADKRMEQLHTCLSEARKAVQTARTAQPKAPTLAPAQSALGDAETGLKEARAAVAKGDPQAALSRLETAQTDCRTAHETAAKLSSSPPAKSKASGKKG